jgi:hypothetical protein
VSIDEPNVALPTLYGAPAYARPPTTAAVGPRPFDPDELPLEVHRTDEERQLVESTASADIGLGSGGRDGSGATRRPFHLREIAGRLLGG